MKILDKIDSPADVRKLSIADQKKLADELREELLQDVAKKGGHLASNLGVVELTIAIHTVFNTPIDKRFFARGAQAVAYKNAKRRKFLWRFQGHQRSGNRGGVKGNAWQRLSYCRRQR